MAKIDDLFAGLATAHSALRSDQLPPGSHLAGAQAWLEEQERAFAGLLENCDPAKRDRVRVEFGFRVRHARDFRDHVRASQGADGLCACRYCALPSEDAREALFRREHAEFAREEFRLRCLSDGEARALAQAGG